MKGSLKYLRYIVVLAILAGLIPKVEGQPKRPNILWINCDDLGQELACYGNTDVKTPHMDQLANEGIRYLNAYANAPVCSSSRSSLITGVYPSAINSLDHRTENKTHLPEGIVPVMELFRSAGYFCSNGSARDLNRKGKEDFNFLGQDWFDGTDWRERKEGQPFFAQVQVFEPHRTFVRDPENPLDYTRVQLPGCYPDHPLIRADWALYLESIQVADRRVGEILQRLEAGGVLDNTIVFLFGDHGRPHLRDKQWLYEGGLKIPLIVRWPDNPAVGTVKADLISLVDVAASSLVAAGIPIPEYMHGKDILGGEKREYVFGFRQRCGDAVDDIRSITDGRYKLIWNRMPNRPYMQLSSYKKLQYPAFTLYKFLHANDKLPSPYDQFMAESRPEFELYDLKNDPDEMSNLSASKAHQPVLSDLLLELKSMLSEVEKEWQAETGETIRSVKSNSRIYLEKGLVRKGLSPDASDKMILTYWEKELLGN